MGKIPFRSSVMLAAALGLFLPAAAQAAPAVPATTTAAASAPTGASSPAALLNPNGALRLDGSFEGPLNLSGWNVQLDAQLGPIFQPEGTEPPPCTGTWGAVGAGGGPALNGDVNALLVDGSDVYAGGDFTFADQVWGANYVAKWNSTSGWQVLTEGALGGPVYALAMDTSTSPHTLYVGGQFTDVDDISTADYVAKWDATNGWAGLGDNGAGNGAFQHEDFVVVDALAVDSSGHLYAGGGFAYVYDGTAINFAAAEIAMWDGTHWNAVGHGATASDPSLNGRVYALAAGSSGNIYAGGNFTNVADGASTLGAADYIAKWNGTNWSALGNDGAGTPNGSLNSAVYAIAVDGSGNVYAAGSFYNVKNSDATTVTAADYVAKWTPGTPGTWSALGSNDGLGTNGAFEPSTLYALAVSGSDVYVGGGFQRMWSPAGVIWATKIAHWNGSAWDKVGNNGYGRGVFDGDMGYMNAIAIYSSGLVAGGSFRRMTDNTNAISNGQYIGLWNGTTSHWSAMGGPQGSVNGTVNAVAVSGGKVYVGGQFNAITDGANVLTDAAYLAMWDGTQWSSVGSSYGEPALHGPVYAIAVSGADVYVGGDFENTGGNDAADYIAKWDGSSWSALGDNSGDGALNGKVYAIVVNGSNVYVGGAFGQITIGGTPVDGASRVAKWDGSVWSGTTNTPMQPGIGDGEVRALALDGSGNLYAGGTFTYVNVTGSYHNEGAFVAMWNGTQWSGVGYGEDTSHPAISGYVYAIAVSGSNVYVGGAFSDVNNQGTVLDAADLVAKWDGTDWSALGSNATGGGSISAITGIVHSIAAYGNDVFVGGSFTDVENPGGAVGAADYIAKWDGTQWSALGSNGSGNGAISNIVGYDGVNAMALRSGKLYAGGDFINVSNGTSAMPLADYLAAYCLPQFTISGNARVAGAVLHYTDVTSKTATANSAGNYSFKVSYYWSGNVTPTKTGCTFTPTKKTYTHVLANQTAQNYSVNCTWTYQSAAAQDGWALESGENTNAGGSVSASAPTLYLGDDAANKQYRDILSFSTSALPDTAVISGATLKLRKQAIVGGGNPITTFQGIYVDLRKGFFSTAATLQTGDFQASASKTGLGPFSPVPSGTLYTITLPSTAWPYINKLATNGGLTQLRLRFKLDDNNNLIANYISFYSGNAASANRPVLTVTFHVP